MKTETIEQIRQSLAVVLGRQSGDLEEAIRRLDHLKVAAEGHLAHYLTRRSYQKAWTLLEGGDPEKGTCGR